MNDLKVRHVRVCVAIIVCASMMFGMLYVATAHVLASPDNAIIKGTVKVGSVPAPDTLVMYSLDSDSPPMGNSTVTDSSGDYELWVDGGRTYYTYYANGGAMFDAKAQLQCPISVGQTKWLNASLTPAPARTVTLKGYLSNASNASEPVTMGHVLGLRTLMGGDPDYINWTAPNSTGYYELMVLPGMVMTAVFDAPGYFPSMGSSPPMFGSSGDVFWLNISLRPFTGYNVNVTGTITDALTTNPIQGAQVTASLDGIGFSYSNTTDAAGAYLVKLIDGGGKIRVTSAGYVSQLLEEVSFTGNMSIDFALNQLDAKVYGFVVDAYTGSPIANATVLIESWIGPSLSQFNQTTTGPDGSYDLSVCGNFWNIYGSATGYGEREVSLTLLSSDLVQQNISLFPESGAIEGYITDSVTGFPIEGASIMTDTMMGPTNMTTTDDLGHYSLNCLPGEYRVTVMAVGYMWEMSVNSQLVGPNATFWLNLSLDPATVSLSGTVTDSISGAPITGASIEVASYSPQNPDFIRVVMTSSAGGNYSAMIAHDEMFTVIMVGCVGYESFEAFTSIPDVAQFWLNISMLPEGAPTYTLQGYVTDSTSTNPIEGAYVEATYGMDFLASAVTNLTGFYSFSVPIVQLTLGVTSDGYLRSELAVPPGSAGAFVWQNVSLDSHTEPPALTNLTVAPDVNVSEHNHANVSVEIAEPYLTQVQLIFARVTEVVNDTAWVQVGESYYVMSMFGTFIGNLKWLQTSPGNWTFYLPDWDTTSENLVMLSDSTGVWWFSDSFGTSTDGTWTVWGQYSNTSLMFPLWGEAVFDAGGNYIGFNNGVIDPGTLTDESGMFWRSANYLQFNLTTGGIINGMDNDTEPLEVHTMHLQSTPVVYPSGDYVAIFTAADIAGNRNFSLRTFSVDNEAPVADAEGSQTEIVGIQVEFNASLSTDNVGIANYTWTIEDGGALTFWGSLVQHVFTTVGNHTVTLTVTDGAGNSASVDVWAEIVPDQAPVADAGPDQVMNEDVLVRFNGTGSHDDLGVTNYTWTIVGLTTVMYGPEPNNTFATPGIYHVRLVVKDTIGQDSAYDEVVIAVSDTTAPVANAGPDQTVNIGSVMTFDGSASTDNGVISAYIWTFTDGTVKTLTGEHPTYTFSVKGNYTVTLTVNDTEGNSDIDTLVVHVNVPPHADAGSDSEVAKGTEVTFDGSGSTDDITVENYTWTFVYDGAQQTLYGPVPKFVFDEPGTYTVQLTVKDVGGLTSTDQVTVTVTGKAGGASFISQYWWLLAVVVVAVVVIAAVLLMRKGKGGAAKSGQDASDIPPPPDESDELVFPPPDDREL